VDVLSDTTIIKKMGIPLFGGRRGGLAFGVITSLQGSENKDSQCLFDSTMSA